MYRREKQEWDVLFICDHFEENELHDLPALMYLIVELEWHFCAEYAYIELLNGHAEKLIILLDLCDPRTIPRKAKQVIKRLM